MERIFFPVLLLPIISSFFSVFITVKRKEAFWIFLSLLFLLMHISIFLDVRLYFAFQILSFGVFSLILSLRIYDVGGIVSFVFSIVGALIILTSNIIVKDDEVIFDFPQHIFNLLRISILIYSLFVLERVSQRYKSMFIVSSLVIMLFEVLWAGIYAIFQEREHKATIITRCIAYSIFQPLIFISKKEENVNFVPFIRSSLSLLGTAIYFVSIAFFREKISGEISLVSSSLLGFMLILVFSVILYERERIKRWINIVLFKSRYDIREILLDFISTMSDDEIKTATNFSKIFEKMGIKSNFYIKLDFGWIKIPEIEVVREPENPKIIGKRVSISADFKDEDREIFSIFGNFALKNIELIIEEREKTMKEAIHTVAQNLSFIMHNLKNALQILDMIGKVENSEELMNSLKERIIKSLKKISTMRGENGFSNLKNVIEKVKKEFDPILDTGKIRVKVNVSDSVLPVSEDSLYQVVYNIVKNSVDELKECSKDEKLIQITSYDSGDNLIVEIEDNGRGIRREDIPKIFNPFFTTKKGGSGLGLFEALEIVKRFGGNISFETSQKGTKFKIFIPKEQKNI